MIILLKRRLQLSGAIVLIYFLSIFLLAVFPQKNLQTLIFGLLIASGGSLTSFLLLREWEQRKNAEKILEPLIPPQPLPVAQERDPAEFNYQLEEFQTKNLELITQLNQKQELIQKFEQEKKQFEHRLEDVAHELNTYKSTTEEELKRKTTLLSEYQETINQQREVLRKKQELVSELESKIHDLNYEIKTLLQLAEIGNSKTDATFPAADHFNDTQTEAPAVPANFLVKNPEEASILLKRCVDIAQKITSGTQFSNTNSRFQMPLNNYALDLRRLFDHLRSETSSTIIVYSQKENRLLFANNQSRNLLGWSVDKIVQNFPDLIQEGGEEWKKSLARLSPNEEGRTRILLKTKSGQNLLVHCMMRAIPTGIFKNHVIGVLFPS